MLIPLAMAGEANAPLAALIGTNRSDPTLLVVTQPRNRDDRFAFFAALAEILVPYLDSFATETEDVPVDRGKDVRQRYRDAPQIWVPNPAGVDFLRMLGRSTRFRTTDGEYPVPAGVPVLGRWLTFFANTAEMPGSCLLLNAVQASGCTGPPARAQPRTLNSASSSRGSSPAPTPHVKPRTMWSPAPPPTPTSTTACWPR